MDKAMQKEIRKILTGRVILQEEGWLIALPEGNPMVFHGLPDGWSSARFRKIIYREEHLQLDTSFEDAFQIVLRRLQDMGRLVYLDTIPEAISCMRRYFTSKSLLISAVPEGGGRICVRAYTGRSLFGGLSCRRGLRDFRHNLPLIEIVDSAKKEEKKKRSREKKKGRD
ncbi:MAG: hypothetical protein Q4B50_05560 [Bacillota bacterium]|nr:hypothetical protein [Bacillota bacterium]